MKKQQAMKKAGYKLDQNGSFIIDNYNLSQPFASFFPGIAGPYGIPIWVFYVNRGQAIASFGTKDKDHAILEYYPANKAWQQTPLQGFRTFIKVNTGKKSVFYEPFHNGIVNHAFTLENKIEMSAYDLKLEETNSTLGITVGVEYFTIPNDNLGALVRIVTLKNTTKAAKKLQVIDGLPQIVPYGTNNFFLKKMSRTIEAWMNVENLSKNAPFYKLAVDPVDRPEVVHIKEGNFYLAFHYDSKNKPQTIKPIVDPACVFGPVTDFTNPYTFLSAQKFKYPNQQALQSKTPCAMNFLEIKLGAHEEKTIYSCIGYMTGIDLLNKSIAKITAPSYLDRKRQENKLLTEKLTSDIQCESANREFDLYAKQTYLDNILRGGYPITFDSEEQSTVFYLYSRKHGDLERDYNRFSLAPTYFSQGNGNYRDVNQNRRSDIWFNPRVKEDNIITFFNLIQSDGFNPLIVKGVNFTLKDSQEFKLTLEKLIAPEKLHMLISFLDKPFTPGELIHFIEENNIALRFSNEEFLKLVLNHSQKLQEVEHGEGFWTDHWTYNLDLLESYFGVYPENLKELIFDKRIFTFYDNFEIIKPRAEKYVLYNKLPRQLHSVTTDSAKKELIRKRNYFPHLARQQYGEGDIYKTTLINKLLCLVANKTASLDPFGIGIEMEADKPNWYDALNGLPALLGSSSCETFELKRFILFIKKTLVETKIDSISITSEILDFLKEIKRLTDKFGIDNSFEKDFIYWDQTHNIKEAYRQKTKFGFSGNEISVPTQDLSLILDTLLKKINFGINKAFDAKSNLFWAYFINEISEYEMTENRQIRPKKFVQKSLPLFLESQMHALKVADKTQDAKRIYEATKKSELFDKALKMYKVTAPLSSMPEEIGRCRIFSPGWLENESIWLHMEYKYLLEILRSGLYEEFYKEFKAVLIPFQKPEIYGRSILENSSFIVSSAFPDKKLHGNGFVARLSGSTAEFISIWLLMNIGPKPFFLNENKELNLCFRPLLANWLFDKKGNYSFKFLSKITVNYHNQKKKNTFTSSGAIIKKISFNDKDSKLIEINSDIIPAPYAYQIRDREITNIDVYLE